MGFSPLISCKLMKSKKLEKAAQDDLFPPIIVVMIGLSAKITPTGIHSK